jgi:hypothetical protein
VSHLQAIVFVAAQQGVRKASTSDLKPKEVREVRPVKRPAQAVVSKVQVNPQIYVAAKGKV